MSPSPVTISKRDAKVEHVSYRDMSATQEHTRGLTSSGRPMNKQEENNMRTKSQRRTLKIHQNDGIRINAKCLGDISLEIFEQSDACEGRRIKLVAATPKRSLLQQSARPGYAGWQGLYILLQCFPDEPKAASQAIVPR